MIFFLKMARLEKKLLGVIFMAMWTMRGKSGYQRHFKKEINRTLCNFVWEGNDKVKRASLINVINRG